MPLPSDLGVRELVAGDVPVVVALVARCDATYREWAPAGWEPPNSERPMWCKKFQDLEYWSRGAFDSKGRLVATVAWEQFCDRGGAVPGVAHVSAVFVDPSRWREGIATALLSQADAAMRRRGYRLARLWTPEAAPARRLYERLEWRHDGRRMWHERLQLHHVGYEKRLMAQAEPGHES